jgi:hypothetical protein
MNAAMNKGVVMEVDKKSIIVMTPSGSFERIPSRNRSCQVGEEIIFASRSSGIRQPVFAVMSVMVAAVVFCMMLFSGIPAVFADKSVVAYVSIDINPSVEIGIDNRERVREMYGLNDKGLELVRSLKYSGKPLEEVADKLLQKAEEMKVFESGEADIVIASTLVNEEASLDDSLVSEHLKQQVLAHVVSKHPDQAEKIAVTAFTAPAEILDSAKETGLSLGKYSVYLNARNEGHDVKVEDLKQDSVHIIAKEAGGISKLVDAAKLKKDSIKVLLEEEKNGSLEKKVQEKKKKEDEKKSSVKPSTKTSSTPGKASNSPAGSKSPSPSPTPKPSTKTTEASNSPDTKDDKQKASKNDDAKDDDKNKNGNGSGNDKKTDKEDGSVKENGSSSSPSGSGTGNSNKDDNPKQEDKNSNVKDEDRKTSGPSADVKQPTPKVSAAPAEEAKEDKNDKAEKNESKNESKKEEKKDESPKN